MRLLSERGRRRRARGFRLGMHGWHGKGTKARVMAQTTSSGLFMSNTDHVHSCKKFRKHTVTGGVVRGDATRGRRGSTLWGGSRRGWREAAFRWVCLRMHVHKGGAPCNRISTWRGNAGSVQLPNERENLIRVRWGAPSAQPPAESAARHPLLPPSELRPAHEPCN